jgi:hypothetical protein
MKRWLVLNLALAGVFLSMGSPRASAQAPGRPPLNPYAGPSFSPYLNLLRGGNPALNYYGLVRPQQDYNALLQSQALAATAASSPLPATGLLEPITGHPSQFMNFSHYYGGRVAGPATLRPALTPPTLLPPAIVPPANLPVSGTLIH